LAINLRGCCLPHQPLVPRLQGFCTIDLRGWFRLDSFLRGSFLRGCFRQPSFSMIKLQDSFSTYSTQMLQGLPPL
jgi:hypothetical protein